VSSINSSQTQSTNSYILKGLNAYRGAFFIGVLFLLLTQYFALKIPGELGASIDLLRQSEQNPLSLDTIHPQIIGHAKLIILFALCSGLFRVLSRIKIFNAGRQIEFDLRNEIYAQLLKLEPNYYKNIATGDLTSRVINDTTNVRLLFGMAVLHLSNTVFAYSMALFFMLAINWQLALICLIPYPLVLYFVQKLARQLHRQTRIVQESLADLSAYIQEDLSGVAMIKSYAIDDIQVSRFIAVCNRYLKENLVLARIRSSLMPLMLSVGSLGAVMALYYGARAVILNSSITLGQFVEFSGYLALLTWPTIALGWVVSIWQRGKASFERIIQILETEPQVMSQAESVDMGEIEQGKIEFKGVGFSYEDSRFEVIKDLNLTIEPGSKIAIVGRSGSGKSTIINLIPRLFDVTEGEIRIDGVPIKEIPLEKLRHAIGYAPQAPFLFSMTIRKNMGFGLTGLPNEEQLFNAVNGANLKQDLSVFKDGIDTMVGERGITLSGGQKQRVALARAIITSPKILLLDDSLSSVDSETEKKIIDALQSVMADRTTVVVTHRYNILELMDQIIVIHEGRLVEQGTPEELIRRGGYYNKMIERHRITLELDEL
jgi:ATP-binding cassette subfamily B protein